MILPYLEKVLFNFTTGPSGNNRVHEGIAISQPEITVNSSCLFGTLLESQRGCKLTLYKLMKLKQNIRN